jgi:hypothetical protein
MTECSIGKDWIVVSNKKISNVVALGGLITKHCLSHRLELVPDQFRQLTFIRQRE